MTREWDNLSVVAKARLAEVEADEKLILSRLMNLATPNERKALERMTGNARAYVLALDEAAKEEAKSKGRPWKTAGATATSRKTPRWCRGRRPSGRGVNRCGGDLACTAPRVGLFGFPATDVCYLPRFCLLPWLGSTCCIDESTEPFQSQP
jgi:hypothetical protein